MREGRGIKAMSDDGLQWAKEMPGLLTGRAKGWIQVLGAALSPDPAWVQVTKCQSVGITEFNASDVDRGPEKGWDLAPATDICGRNGAGLVSWLLPGLLG